MLNPFSVRTHALKNSPVREDGMHLVVAAEDGLGRTVVDDRRCLADARVGGQVAAVFRVGREGCSACRCGRAYPSPRPRRF